MLKVFKFKDVEKVIEFYDEYNLSMSGVVNVLLKYKEDLINISKVLDYIQYRSRSSKNIKKDLKQIIKDNNITEYMFIESIHILINNISNISTYDTKVVIGDKYTIDSAIDKLGNFSVYKVLYYVCTLIYTKKFKFNIKSDTTIVDDFGKTNLTKNSYLSTIGNTLFVNSVEDDRPELLLLVESGGVSYKTLNPEICNDVMTKQNVDSYLVNYYLSKLLEPDLFNFYVDKMDLNYNILRNVLSEVLNKEVITYPSTYFLDLLRNRNFIIPLNGISISTELERELYKVVGKLKCESSSAGYDLDIYERQLNGENYLIIIDTTRDFYTSVIINLTKSISYSTSSNLYEILNRLVYLYNLQDSIDLITFPLYSSYRVESTEFGSVAFIRGTNSILSDYFIEIPYYWRFRNSVTKSNSNNTRVSRARFGETYTKLIGAFTRKLADGQSVSLEAKQAANLYCLNLKEGETLVKPHPRHYKVNI